MKYWELSSSSDAVAIVDQIRASLKFYVTAHIIPDGDTIGSALAMYWGLKQLGKQVRVACADSVPQVFQTLPGSELIKAQKPDPDDLILVLDSSSLERLGSIYESSKYKRNRILNIDHHVTNDNFGLLNWIQPQATSTAEMVIQLLQALRVEIDPHIADCLLTGIVTDTLGFRTNGTSPELLESVAQLMRAGAQLSLIIEKAFNTRELAELQLQGRILSEMHVEDGLIWADNTIQMRHEVGIQSNDSGKMVGVLLTAKSARVSVIFIERNDGKIEVSMRSRPGYDVSGVAVLLAGGGHPQAAGCLIKGTLREAHERVLPILRETGRLKHH